MGKVNDLDLTDGNWKEYPELLTDSLWLFSERDGSGAHQASYHGNFVPQIPYQLLRRFTSPGDIVLDPYMGGGTTLMEANRLNRRSIGIELSECIANQARERIAEDAGVLGKELSSYVMTGDSTSEETYQKVEEYLQSLQVGGVQLLILHPPYYNIIHFTDFPEDLSNSPNLESYLELFMKSYSYMAGLLERGRYVGLVIGDLYIKGEHIPLQNWVTSAILATGKYRLKSIIVKNQGNTRAKRRMENLWRYRALYGGFYLFKHEYVVIFQKL